MNANSNDQLGLWGHEIILGLRGRIKQHKLLCVEPHCFCKKFGWMTQISPLFSSEEGFDSVELVEI
jgi:hypothetical protein